MEQSAKAGQPAEFRAPRGTRKDKRVELESIVLGLLMAANSVAQSPEPMDEVGNLVRQIAQMHQAARELEAGLLMERSVKASVNAPMVLTGFAMCGPQGRP